MTTEFQLDERHWLLQGAQKSSEFISVFNAPAFIELHAASAKSILKFELEDRVSGKILGRCNFAVTPERIKTPIRGSYGGFEFTETLPGPLVESFILKVIELLRAQHELQIEIVAPPFCYDEAEASLLHNILVRGGFTDQVVELNHHREIRAGEEFAALIDYGNVKRIRKATELKLGFRLLEYALYEEAYELIADNRERRGFPITMTWPQLLDMVKTFPDRMRFFAAYEGSAMVASAVCILLKPAALYVFYWADADGQKQLSPVSFLAKGIYEYCQKESIRLLDVGTSTVDGVPNWGLVRYKQNLGFRSSLKIRYRSGDSRG